MKKIALIAVAAGLLLSVQPADAACVSARIFSTFAGVGDQSFLYTPGPQGYFTPYATANGDATYPLPFGGQITYYAQGAFWSLGNGNPVVGLGNDSGLNTGLWFDYFAPGFYGPSGQWLTGFNGIPAEINNTNGYNNWQFPGSDGCIDADLPDACMVILLSDKNYDTRDPEFPNSRGAIAGAGRGAEGSFALLAANNNVLLNYDFSQPGNAPVNLAPLPDLQITGSTGISPSQLQVTVNVPTIAGPAQGLYLNCLPAQNDALQNTIQYNVYQLVSPNAGFASPPAFPTSTREVADPNWVPVGGPFPLGSPQVVNITTTPGDDDAWLCASLVFDPASGGGFETFHCSPNSVRAQVGPNEAQPDDLLKPDAPIRVNKPAVPTLPRGQRGERGGR